MSPLPLAPPEALALEALDSRQLFMCFRNKIASQRKSHAPPPPRWCFLYLRETKSWWCEGEGGDGDGGGGEGEEKSVC